MGNHCGAHTFPYIEAENKTAQIEHEATTSKIGEDQIFYCNQRGIDPEKAIALVVNGFSRSIEQTANGICRGSKIIRNFHRGSVG